MKRNTYRTSIVTCAVLSLVVMTSQASAVILTDSNQLNLAGRQVLSAVSFYTPGGGQPNAAVQVTSPIQGFAITNYPDQNGTIGELTVSLPNQNSDRGQSATSITGTGIDQAPTIQLANSVTYWSTSGSQSGFLSYAFGAGFSNTPVEVQIVGGESGWNGTINVSVGGDLKGSLTGDTNISTADLLTFSSITDGSGNLVVDITSGGGNFYGIAGAFVTAAIPVPAPEPSSLLLLGLGTLGLVRSARRRMAKA